jgi:hypothetical protein
MQLFLIVMIVYTQKAVFIKTCRNVPGTSGSTYNPNYSGGRDQEDWGLRPAQTPVPPKKKKAFWNCTLFLVNFTCMQIIA